RRRNVGIASRSLSLTVAFGSASRGGSALCSATTAASRSPREGMVELDMSLILGTGGWLCMSLVLGTVDTGGVPCFRDRTVPCFRDTVSLLLGTGFCFFRT